MKDRSPDTRYDFRQGRNTAVSPDLLNPSELVDATNARIDTVYGGFTKRSGTRRLHVTALGAPSTVTGVYQWPGQNAGVGNDTFTDGGTTSGFTTQAWNHTVSAGLSNSILVVIVTSDTADPASITYGGVALTKFGTNNNGTQFVSIWYLKAPTSGTAQVLVTYSVASNATGGSASFQHVNQATPWNPAGPQTATASSITVTSNTNEMIIAGFVVGGTGQTVTLTGNQQQIHNDIVSTSHIGASAFMAGAPNGIVGWTVSGTLVGGSLQSDGSVQTAELVAISNGNFYHKTSAFGDFTSVVPSTPFTSILQTFVVFRAKSTGAPLNLYIAGTGFYRWTGNNLTNLFPTGLPTDASLLAVFPTRLFLAGLSAPKNIFWSQVGNSENFTTSGLASDGGTALVGVLNGESITAMEVINSSLLMAGPASVSRFTGTSSDSIQIASDTAGISAEIGAVGPNALKRFETTAGMLSERGPYIVNETGLAPIGIKVEPDFLFVQPSKLPGAAIGYHRGRKELWFAIPGVNDSGLNKTVYVYSTRLQSWMGPWTYPFGIVSFTRYVDSNGNENLAAGCSDGFVRLMDDVGSYLDDRLASGSGGSAYTMNVEVAPHFGSGGAQVVKTVQRMLLDADLTTGALTISHAADGGALTNETVTSAGSGLLPYRVDMYEQGKRIRIVFNDASSGAPIIFGYSLVTFDMNRV